MKVITLLRAANILGQAAFRYLQREWRFCVRIALLLIACAGAVLPSVHAFTHPWSTRQLLRSEKASSAGSLWLSAVILDDDDDDDQQSATGQERFVPPCRATVSALFLTQRQAQAGLRVLRTPPPLQKVFYPLKIAPPSPVSDWLPT